MKHIEELEDLVSVHSKQSDKLATAETRIQTLQQASLEAEEKVKRVTQRAKELEAAFEAEIVSVKVTINFCGSNSWLENCERDCMHLKVGIDKDEYICQLEIEIAKLKAAQRLEIGMRK